MIQWQVRNGKLSIGRQRIFCDLTLAVDFPAGTVTALVGKSGSGKSSLMRLIAGHIKLESGESCLAGKDSPRAVYVHQSPVLLEHLSRFENANLRAKFGRDKRSVDQDKFEFVKSALGLDGGFLDSARPLTPLSGGEQQRLALLRDTAIPLDLLILDEPFSALDRGSRLDAYRAILAISGGLGYPILFATHDRADIEALAAQVVLLESDFPDRPRKLTVHGRQTFLALPPSAEAAELFLPPDWRLAKCFVDSGQLSLEPFDERVEEARIAVQARAPQESGTILSAPAEVLASVGSVCSVRVGNSDPMVWPNSAIVTLQNEVRLCVSESALLYNCSGGDMAKKVRISTVLSRGEKWTYRVES